MLCVGTCIYAEVCVYMPTMNTHVIILPVLYITHARVCIYFSDEGYPRNEGICFIHSNATCCHKVNRLGMFVIVAAIVAVFPMKPVPHIY